MVNLKTFNELSQNHFCIIEPHKWDGRGGVAVEAAAATSRLL